MYKKMSIKSENLPFTGGELDLITPRVVAACNQQIAQQFVDLIKKADSEILNKNLN